MEPRGCNRWQAVANAVSAKRGRQAKPLPWVATGCREEYMVNRASAVSCHPLREVPSLRGRRSTCRPSGSTRRPANRSDPLRTIMQDLVFARARSCTWI